MSTATPYFARPFVLLLGLCGSTSAIFSVYVRPPMIAWRDWRICSWSLQSNCSETASCLCAAVCGTAVVFSCAVRVDLSKSEWPAWRRRAGYSIPLIPARCEKDGFHSHYILPRNPEHLYFLLDLLMSMFGILSLNFFTLIKFKKLGKQFKCNPPRFDSWGSFTSTVNVEQENKVK